MLFLSFRIFFIVFIFISVLSNAQYMNTNNCNAINCKMPNCYCPSLNIPGNLSLAKTPQFIYFSFDDSMYEDDYTRMNNYSWVLNNTSIRDSLNCTIKLSWYALEICKILHH